MPKEIVVRQKRVDGPLKTVSIGWEKAGSAAQLGVGEDFGDYGHNIWVDLQREDIETLIRVLSKVQDQAFEVEPSPLREVLDGVRDLYDRVDALAAIIEPLSEDVALALSKFDASSAPTYNIQAGNTERAFNEAQRRENRGKQQ